MAFSSKRSAGPFAIARAQVDLHSSTVECLSWLIERRLLVAGTLVRYDDWPRKNATHGGHKGTNYYGQARAHYELSEKWDVRWKLCAFGLVQVLSIGADRCAPELCDKAAPLRKALNLGEDALSNRMDARLLPLWSPQHTREGLS